MEFVRGQREREKMRKKKRERRIWIGVILDRFKIREKRTDQLRRRRDQPFRSILSDSNSQSSTVSPSTLHQIELSISVSKTSLTSNHSFILPNQKQIPLRIKSSSSLLLLLTSHRLHHSCLQFQSPAPLFVLHFPPFLVNEH